MTQVTAQNQPGISGTATAARPYSAVLETSRRGPQARAQVREGKKCPIVLPSAPLPARGESPDYRQPPRDSKKASDAPPLKRHEEEGQQGAQMDNTDNQRLSRGTPCVTLTRGAGGPAGTSTAPARRPHLTAWRSQESCHHFKQGWRCNYLGGGGGHPPQHRVRHAGSRDKPRDRSSSFKTQACGTWMGPRKSSGRDLEALASLAMNTVNPRNNDQTSMPTAEAP